jgi:hypothetical protein
VLLTFLVLDSHLFVALLARRSVIDVGGFDEPFSTCEDQVLLAKICLVAPVYVESGRGE